MLTWFAYAPVNRRLLPSAMFAGTETAERRNCDARSNAALQTRAGEIGM
jgi:hypothetical protein